MIGDIKLIGKDVYFQVNNGGTLVKMPKTSWYRALWLSVRDFFKKWNQNEAVKFAKGDKA